MCINKDTQDVSPYAKLTLKPKVFHLEHSNLFDFCSIQQFHSNHEKQKNAFFFLQV